MSGGCYCSCDDYANENADYFSTFFKQYERKQAEIEQTEENDEESLEKDISSKKVSLSKVVR